MAKAVTGEVVACRVLSVTQLAPHCSRHRRRFASTHRSDATDNDVPLPAIPYALALALVQFEQTDEVVVASLLIPVQKFRAPEKLF
jgi:hypothetical protein